MKKESYEHICQLADSGQDAFISHPDSGERGMVTSCIRQTGHLVARTTQGQMRCWTFGECEEPNHVKSGPMI